MVFYSKGLQFECTQCSNCCRHDPGYVLLSSKDTRLLLDFLVIPQEEFIHTYCKKIFLGGLSQLSLIEKANYDCIFWSEDGCRVYEARPLQCRTYPFWAPILKTEETWLAESRHCPGINRGKFHEPEKIEASLREQKEQI